MGAQKGVCFRSEKDWPMDRVPQVTYRLLYIPYIIAVVVYFPRYLRTLHVAPGVWWACYLCFEFIALGIPIFASWRAASRTKALLAPAPRRDYTKRIIALAGVALALFAIFVLPFGLSAEFPNSSLTAGALACDLAAIFAFIVFVVVARVRTGRVLRFAGFAARRELPEDRIPYGRP